MKLTGDLKEKVEKAENLEEAKPKTAMKGISCSMYIISHTPQNTAFTPTAPSADFINSLSASVNS